MPITSMAWMRNEPANGSVMPNAVVTAHTSAAPRNHTGIEYARARKNCPGLLATLRPTPKCATAVAMRRPSPTGSARVHHAVSAARRSGWAAMAHTTTTSVPRDGRRHAGRRLDGPQGARRHRRGVREAEDVDRQQRQHRDEVEDALHHDGRKGRGDAVPLLAGQQIGPQHVPGTRGQHAERGEPDDRGAEGRSEARMPERLQQHLPSDGPRPERGGHQHERRGAVSRGRPRAPPPTRR